MSTNIPNPAGLKRHEYFAACALLGILSSSPQQEDAETVAIKALEYANALELHFHNADKARKARMAGKEETSGPFKPVK